MMGSPRKSLFKPLGKVFSFGVLMFWFSTGRTSAKWSKLGLKG
jgi:extradiol dioxygenase family protein